MRKLVFATAALALLAAPVAQATEINLPGSVEDFIDYVCDLEDDGDIPPPFPAANSYLTPAEVVISQAFDAYVEAGLIDAEDLTQYVNESCDYCSIGLK